MAQRSTSTAPKLVLQAGLIAVAIGIGMEATARLEDWVAYRSPILNRYHSESDLVVRTADGMHGRRHASFEKWSMNNLGYRGPDADSAKTPGRLRVVAIGASEMFGLYESAGKELPRQIEDSLRSRLSGSHCGAEVWNGALPGMTIPTIMQDLRLRTRRFSPDVVVLYPTPPFYLGNDLPTPTTPDSQKRETTLSFVNAFYPRIWPRLRNQIKALTPTFAATWLRKRTVAAELRAHSAGWQFETLPVDRAIAFEADLRREVGAVREIGAEPVLATHGDAFWRGAHSRGSSEWLIAWERFNPRATSRVLIAFDSAAREATLRVAADSGLLVADTALALAASAGTPFADYQHFNDHGSAVAAGVISQQIVELMTRSRLSACR